MLSELEHAPTSLPVHQQALVELPDVTQGFEGHVDFYGYHKFAKGFFFCGWMSHPWPNGDRPRRIVAHLGSDMSTESTLSTFYFREDVKTRGIGFIVFFACSPEPPVLFPHLEIHLAASSHEISPTPDAPCLRDAQLVEWLQDLLAGGEAESHRRRMHALLLGTIGEAAHAPAAPTTGFLDFYGHHDSAGGWLFCGWISEGWRGDMCPDTVTACFEGGDIAGDAIATLHPRRDLGAGEGMVLFLHGPAASLGALCSISFTVAGVRASLNVGPAIQRLRPQELGGRVKAVLAGCAPGAARDGLLAILNRQPYAGQDTLATLAERIFFEIDEAILCEPDGLALMGWFLARPGIVREIRLRCGPLNSVLKLDECITLDRPDVIAAVGAEHGYDDPRCGFVGFLPGAVVANTRIHVEIETYRREVGFRAIPMPKLSGMAAIRRLLGGFDVRYTEVAHAYGRVVGPAVGRLNASRLAARPGVAVMDHGMRPAAPKYSVIVPLHGRLDYVEYQLALFSAYPPNAECEFIYVLDDPPRRGEARFLFASLYERFRIPFRVLLLDRNVGYAPANNIGLEHASGEFVAFVNSDVFPGTPDWLERLAARLTAEPDLGVIGPLLLFEDGSVQHQGMYFKALDEFGGWSFGHHEAKGRRYSDGPGLRRSIAITGACMLMRRMLARDIGGFDEAYVIGDFEDSDLCFRLRWLGLACAVDPDVRLYHLERKSQASAALNWRMNLTLYNAWVHQRRWAEIIVA